MKTSLFKLLIFIFIVLALDRIAGFTCQRLFSRTKDFTISKLRYSIDSTREDVLILGSSRAEHHFFPRIISQITGYSIYNCGVGGEDLNFSLVQLKESLKRYRPKYVVVETSPSSLFIPNAEENLKVLLPYYNKDSSIFNLLTKGETVEKIKFISAVYPYNFTIGSILTGILKQKTDTLNGFLPLYGTIDTNGLASKVYAGLPPSLKMEKFAPLNELVSMCADRNIKVVLVNSPVYVTNNNYDSVSKQISEISARYKNVYYLDYSKYSNVYNRTNYFKDNTHLNFEGAKVFSEAVSYSLKKIINENPVLSN